VGVAVGVAVGQLPQSLAQFEQLSVASQIKLPQTAGHPPQSIAQFEQSSVASQLPLPQACATASLGADETSSNPASNNPQYVNRVIAFSPMAP